MSRTATRTKRPGALPGAGKRAREAKKKDSFAKLALFQQTLTSASETTLDQPQHLFFPDKVAVRCPEPACEYELSRDEVQEGFLSREEAFETTCPACGNQFLALDRITDSVTGKESLFVWLGDDQTRAAFRHCGRAEIDFVELARRAPHIAWNAYRAALRKGAPCVPKLEFIEEVSMAFLNE